MDTYSRASTGVTGFDRLLDGLRLGDCLCWQTDEIGQYARLVTPFVRHALDEGRDVIYLRFGDHEPLITGADTRSVDASQGFEHFASVVHEIISEADYGTFFVFDSLTSLLFTWRSDLAVGNFFRVTATLLFERDDVAYFGLVRPEHTFSTLAMIRDSTQVLVDIYSLGANTYAHPLKVWLRHSPTMFFPHVMHDDDVTPVTDSLDTARLMAHAAARTNPVDHWKKVIERARSLVDADEPTQRDAADQLIDMYMGREDRVVELCRTYLTLPDLISIADREVGTGYVGGKSVGMLVARAILEHAPDERFAPYLEKHDSFFLGSDLFYAFIIANGWWNLWMEQRSPRGYFSAGASLNSLMVEGRFPPSVREQFMALLDYFGTSPIIVRSSSLLEDNFGNAFAGKYESVFCANQGTPEQRLHALEDAVRRVYASAMCEEALAYRRNRGLDHVDEQMAILVQRVSGSQHGEYFFPHVGGVGNSANVYVWDQSIDPNAGMLRIVFGLGTRAVDRTITDYARLVTLDDPTRQITKREAARHTQRYVDMLSLQENALVTRPLVELSDTEIGADWELFRSVDVETLRWLRDNNRPVKKTPTIVDFAGLIADTPFAELMRDILATLSSAYDYPVDIEYTLNVGEDGLRVNIVQCRPLQVHELGGPVEIPENPGATLVSLTGDFMGTNTNTPIRSIILVRPEPYLALGYPDRYAVARAIGKLNRLLADEPFMVMAPGRWGTTTPSLGIPVTFTEVSNATAMAEFTYSAGGFLPELSQGSHFFQDIVEQGIVYLAIFDRQKDTIFNSALITDQPNMLAAIDPALERWSHVIHVARFDDMHLVADVRAQRLLVAQDEPPIDTLVM